MEWFDDMSASTYPCLCMDAPERPLVWLHGEVWSPPFSSQAKIEAGVLLRKLQKGEKLSMPHSRPMPVIGRGCHELRIPDRNVIRRIIYFIDTDAIVILDVFEKKTKETPPRVVGNCKRCPTLYRAAG